MKKDYHNARKKVLKKVETGEIDLGAIAAKEAKAKAEKEGVLPADVRGRGR